MPLSFLASFFHELSVFDDDPFRAARFNRADAYDFDFAIATDVRLRSVAVNRGARSHSAARYLHLVAAPVRVLQINRVSAESEQSDGQHAHRSPKLTFHSH